MFNTITLPLNITFERWSAQLVIDLPQYQVPILYPVNKWWDWVDQLIYTNNLPDVLISVKEIYKNESDWSIWAAFFVDTINSLDSG